MGFFADLIPFYPKREEPKKRKPPKYDVDRALDVEVHGHPTLQQHRADNGELVLMVQRKPLPGEEFLGRFFTLNRMRRLVLDEYGSFMLEQALKPGVKLTAVAETMAREFDLDLEDAKLGVIHLVRDLMLREYVFLVRRNADGGTGEEQE